MSIQRLGDSELKTFDLILVEDTGDNVAIVQSGMRSKHTVLEWITWAENELLA